MTALFQDLRYGLRMLTKNPGFTAVAVLTLALGIGANTAMFSVVNAVLIRPLPYPHSENLVWVSDYVPRMNMSAVTDPDYEVWCTQNKVFEQLAAYGGGADYNLTGQGRPQRVTGRAVTANFLPLLGVNPILGRNFLADEDLPGTAPDSPRVSVVIITHRLWDRLGSPRRILGERLMLDGATYTVAGVLPVAFRFPAESQPDLLRPLGLSPQPRWDVRKPQLLLRVIGRLKPGVTAEQARNNLTVMNEWIRTQLPPPLLPMLAGIRADVVPLQRELVGDARSYLLILFGAVGFVLLIACANVANLQMERTTTRRKEIAVRMALGAGRGRVARRLLTESLLMALAGSMVALVMALGAIRVLRVLAPREISDPSAITIDPWVFMFALALAGLSTILFGLAPAAQAAKTELNEALKDGGQGEAGARFRLRNLLVISEIGLAVVLVIGSGLLIRSFGELLNVDRGFNSSQLLTAQTWLPPTEYSKPAQQIAFLQGVIRRVKALPGVVDAAGGTGMPFSEFELGDRFEIEGQPPPPEGMAPTIPLTSVSESYFRTLQVPLVSGRFFTAHDTQGSLPAIIVNQAFVSRFLARQNPIGKRVGSGRPNSEWSTIVGVVGNVRYRGLDHADEPVVYSPYLQRPAPFISLLARTTSDPASLAAALRTQVEAVDKSQPVFDIQTMQQRVDATLGSRRFNLFLLTAFALLALILAAIGLYGVMAYSVAECTHEIGIRMALGAQRSQVMRMILRRGLLLTLAGIAAGLLAAFNLTALLGNFLYGVKPLDALTFVLVPVVLVAVALVATFVPARRATKVDPMVALRHE